MGDWSPCKQREEPRGKDGTTSPAVSADKTLDLQTIVLVPPGNCFPSQDEFIRSTVPAIMATQLSPQV